MKPKELKYHKLSIGKEVWEVLESHRRKWGLRAVAETVGIAFKLIASLEEAKDTQLEGCKKKLGLPYWGDAEEERTRMP